MPATGEAKAGGPSIDQVVRRTSYPNGLPSGMVPTLVGGTYFRRSRVGRMCTAIIMTVQLLVLCKRSHVIYLIEFSEK